MNGNAIIGQSGGPTSVINSSLCGVIQKAAQSKNIDKIYGMRFAIEGFLNNEIIDLSAVDAKVIEGLRHTPGSALGSCRHKLQEEDLPVILELFKKYDIRYFFLIGGNDTMDTIHRVEAYCKEKNYNLIGVGVPKTVDNDLFGTDHTPGFASAARYVALSTQQGGILASDMQRVDKFVIQQTVGRDAGWLAASSAMARKREGDAPHLIYMPERPLNRENVLNDVKTVIDKYGWASIVCGEGITWEDGTPVSASQAKDKFSNVEFGAMGGSSAALNLHQLISNEFGYRGEFQITESLPMSAIDRASEVDLEEAYQCGLKAVELADEGVTGVMVSMVRESNDPYKIVYKTASLSDVAIKAKPMPEEYIAECGTDVTQAFIDYLKPLIGSFPTYSILR